MNSHQRFLSQLSFSEKKELVRQLKTVKDPSDLAYGVVNRFVMSDRLSIWADSFLNSFYDIVFHAFGRIGVYSLYTVVEFLVIMFTMPLLLVNAVFGWHLVCRYGKARKGCGNE